jgi:hypothetical protein
MMSVGSRTPVGHVHHRHAEPVLEHLAEDLPARADALRAKAQAAGLGLRQRDKVGDRLHRAVGRHHQDVRERDDRRDRRHVLHRIEVHLRIEDRVDRHQAHVGEEQRVAVRRRRLGRLRRDVAAAARRVVDDDGRLHVVGGLLRDRPDHRVGAATGREGDQQRDRA